MKYYSYLLVVFLIVLTVTSCSEKPTEPKDGTVTDIDGNIYPTRKIGNQIWMVENLRVTHYRNGEPMLHVTGLENWILAEVGIYGAWNNAPNLGKGGYLYNYHAVINPSGLAPEGWRVATDEDYKQLEKYLGMPESELDENGFRGEYQGSVGSKLAGWAYSWLEGWGITNDPNFGKSGFYAIGMGFRDQYGQFTPSNSPQTAFWTSTIGNLGPGLIIRMLHNSNVGVYRYDYSGYMLGGSVRCIKE